VIRKSAALLVLVCSACAFAQSNRVITKSNFKNPPSEYRPIGGADKPLPQSDLLGKLKMAYDVQGFGGYMFAPSGGIPSAQSNSGAGAPNHVLSMFLHPGGGLLAAHAQGESPWVMIFPPGTDPGHRWKASDATGTDAASTGPAKPVSPPQPGYLSQQYFDQVKEFLAYTKKTGHTAVFYDEVGYPSGMANHTTPKELRRKVLDKTEESISGPGEYRQLIPEEGVLMAVVAMNKTTLERIDLTPLVKGKSLVWHVPAGEWLVMTFNCRTLTGELKGVDYDGAVDYLDPDAARWFIDKNYEAHYKEIGHYFGSTIIQSFFDDVGIFPEERTWTAKFNDKFKALTGKDAAIYYPALWMDIGPETESARVAFFNTRAELLADGFPKAVTEWGAKHNLPVTGHAPGNYEIQPVDMCADPFKFDRAQPIPMVDVIFFYPFGRDGFKLASDGGDLYDKPIVNAEVFAEFVPGGSTAGYRRTMELYVRGINRFSGAGLARRDQILGAPATFAEWTGRTSLLLQGGRRVSEIAVFYPITALEAFYHFDAPEYTAAMRWGTFVPYDTDYLAIGEMLLNQVHRDFTFIHPDVLLSKRIEVKGSSLVLDNKVNRQSYKALILPGERVISLSALQKIKAYYDAGGVLVATSLLPSKAAELAANSNEAIANDQKVQAIVKEIFAIDSSKLMPEGISNIRTNAKNGRSVFIRKPDANVLKQTLEKLGVGADVEFANNPTPLSSGGVFSYVHKNKEGHDIYYFANSSDDVVDTFAELRGKLKPQLWDPLTGDVTPITQVEQIEKGGASYTRFPLKLSAVKAVFVVGGL
jgi:hypothetical protein